MSLTAGFDIVFELSDAALERFLMTQLPPALLPATGPVELPVFEVLGWTVYMVLDQVIPEFGSAADGSPVIRIKVTHNKTSISGMGLPHPVCPLQGSFIVEAPIRIVSLPKQNSTLLVQQAQIDLKAASVTHAFDNPGLLDSTMPERSTLVSDVFSTQFHLIVQNIQLASGDAAAALGPPIDLNPTGDGGFVPFTITRIEVKHVVGGLVFFLNIRDSTRGNGNVDDKTAVHIPPGSDVALHISPDCFHHSIFCPIASQQVKIERSSLPPTCSNGAPFRYHSNEADEDFDITRLHDTLEFGRVRIDGTFEKSGFCYELTGSFVGQLTFSSSLDVTYKLLDTTSDFNVDWYCEAAAAVIGALTGGAAYGVFAFLGVKLFEGGMNDLFKNKFKAGLFSMTMSGTAIGSKEFPQISFRTPIIAPEGFTLPGSLRVGYTVYHPQQLEVNLTGVIADEGRQVIEQGSVELKTPCEPTANIYPWTLSTIAETASFDLATVGYVRPLRSVHWTIYVPAPAPRMVDAFQLGSAGEGEIELDVETVTPNLQGEMRLKQTVRVAYKIAQQGIVLKNKTPERGTYVFGLECRGTDCAGQTMMAWKSVGFEGLLLKIGGGWDEKWEECLRWIFEQLKGKLPQLATMVPLIEKVDRPPPERFKHFLDTFIRYADKDAFPMIRLTKLAHAQTVARVHIQDYAERITLALQTTQTDAPAGGEAFVGGFEQHMAALRAQIQKANAELALVEAAMYRKR